mmetsp:Transcript_35837/g.92621  ORF Transcript_35837/g.92621 Transcript_35837/m.92621 type:complete len:126 (+) Transcript_35837:1973-2350(+)
MVRSAEARSSGPPEERIAGCVRLAALPRLCAPGASETVAPPATPVEATFVLAGGSAGGGAGGGATPVAVQRVRRPGVAAQRSPHALWALVAASHGSRTGGPSLPLQATGCVAWQFASVASFACWF